MGGSGPCSSGFTWARSPGCWPSSPIKADECWACRADILSAGRTGFQPVRNLLRRNRAAQPSCGIEVAGRARQAGRRRPARRDACPTSVAEILELERHGEIMGAHRGNDGLKIVLALAGHADLVSLDLRRDLEFEIADEAGDLFGHGGLDALFDRDDLT